MTRGKKPTGPPPDSATSDRTPPETAASAADRWAGPPTYLEAEDAAAWWPLVVAELRARGRIHLLVPFQVAQFCQLLAQWWRATKRVEKRGKQVDQCVTVSGVVKRSVSPEVRLQLDLLDALRKTAKDFGLNEPPLELTPTDGKTDGGRNRLRGLLGEAFGSGNAGRN